MKKNLIFALRLVVLPAHLVRHRPPRRAQGNPQAQAEPLHVASVTDPPFGIPDDFDLRAFIGDAWRMIGGPTYRVSVASSPILPTPPVKPAGIPRRKKNGITKPAGSRCVSRSMAWRKFAFLGYGPGATVLEPPELIQRVRELARATAGRYARP